MAGACWLDISKFAEAGYEEDEVDQIGWYTDWTELLQDKVQDVAQVDGAQDRGKAEKTLKRKKMKKDYWTYWGTYLNPGNKSNVDKCK